MRIDQVKHIEDCFDGSFIKEFAFSETVTEAFIQYLGQHGKLTYFKTFARPFYKVVFLDNYYIKGVEGNSTARALLWKEENIIRLKELVEQYQPIISEKNQS